MTEDFQHTGPATPRPVEFVRLPDGGIELIIPNDAVDALGWEEDDDIEVLFDIEGRLVLRKIISSTD